MLMIRLLNWTMKTCLSALSAVVAFTSISQAGLTISFEQQGTDLFISAAGSVDVSGLVFVGDVAPDLAARNVRADPDRFTNTSGGDDLYRVANEGNLFTESFNTIAASDFSGDSFGLYASDIFNQFAIYVPDGFVSGPISGSLTFPNTLLTDLGPIQQTRSWGPGPDQFVRVSIVPEPTGLALVLSTGWLAEVVTRRRHRRDRRE